MARSSPPRRQADRRPGSPTRLRVEALEDRAVPATLTSTDFTLTSQAGGESAVVGASDDGRYIIIQSTAADFVEDQIDTEGDVDLFWLDRVTGERFLVSALANTGGLSAAGVVPSDPGLTANAVISGDGQTVAFVSKANAATLVGGFNPPNDAGDATEDVFVWSVDQARNIGGFFNAQPIGLASQTIFGNDAIGLTNTATNPALSDDGSIVAFVSRRDAGDVGSILDIDNGDLTPDVFRGSVNVGLASVTVQFIDTVTVFPDPLNLNRSTAFGNYTGFVTVDALGRYMSGDGTTFAVVSSLNPNKLNPSFTAAPGGTIDAYFIRADTFFGTQDIVLASSRPGLPNETVGGQVGAAIIPSEAPNTIVFSANVPAGSPGLVPGYVNQNGDRADLYWRQILGIDPQPAILVSSEVGRPTAGGNAGLDLATGSFSTSEDGSQVFFTSPATNMVTIADTNGVNDIFVRDIDSGVTSAVSVTPGGASTGNGISARPRPTPDGFLVAFESKATNLSTILDTNAGRDIFVRNLVNNTTGVASATADNSMTGNAPSFAPFIGGTKSNAVVLFDSLATNLDPAISFPGGQQNVFSATAPIAAVAADRIVAVSGGLSGFAGLARFDAAGALQSGPPIAPFPGFRGEIRVASADVNGDGVVDLIAGAGPGGGPRVRVLSGIDFQPIADIFAFESTFTGGVSVASADFNGDGFADVVVGAGDGGGPRILIFDGQTQGIIADLFVFEQSFRGGVRVSTGDFNGDGIPDLIAAAGEGGGPRIKVINGADLAGMGTFADFFAFEQTLRNGVYVGAGDINGDGLADVAAGAGPGGGPRVSVFDANTFLANPANDPNTARIIDYFAYDSASRDGVRVAIKNADGDGLGDIVTGPGSGPPLVRVFTTSRFADGGVPQQLSEQFAFDEPAGRLGAYVG